ncbi:MAG: sulfotransferase [Gammaproteobacteria bacterium]
MTGSPRSGTTWVGQMLAKDHRLYYVHEPFNPASKYVKKHYNLRLNQHFIHICDENSQQYYSAITDLINGKYNLLNALTYARSLQDLRSTFREWRQTTVQKNKGILPLIKDPIALMSAEWLYNNFDIRCVVLIRHPAAFVSSMKRLNWVSHPENWALSQPLLIRDFLKPLESEINALRTGEHDIIERAALAWKIHHLVISKYYAKHEDWIFLRHEDISKTPMDSFEKLYHSLGLTFNNEIRQIINEHSSETNPDSSTGKDKPIRLNSQQNISSWKKRLASDEVARIRDSVEDISTQFYSDDDWLT